jgi:hypothetical protein
MDWKTASSHYAARLSDTLTVHRYALDLANLPQAQVPDSFKQILIEEADPTRRQLERLKKGEFRIAVVGLEKAGKSTFINAWLECDLLPAKGGRCTFTTTQIYSVANESDQRLEVQVRTEKEFQSFLQELEAAGAHEDLKTIAANQETLEIVKREGNLTIPFTRLEDIREPLKKYVADEKYAYAVLEARLYTNKLAQADGIVFYDVPGSDSGLAKHSDEAKAILSDCDAVIVIQRFRSIREAELEIIQFTEIGDKNVKIADKLFVFLSHIDALGTAAALEQHIAEASQDWQKRANLPEKRIVAGSAGAYLILNNLAGEQTKLEIGNPETIRRKLQDLTNINEESRLNTEATGIPEIKQRIEHYINNERVDVLKKRCEASIHKIIDTSEEIYRLVRQRYPENPEEAKQMAEEQRRIAFTEWWHDKWEEIKADLQNFYTTSVVGDQQKTSLDSLKSQENFKQRYFQVVQEEMQALRQQTLKKKDRIFAANSNPVFDRDKANILWREDLYNDLTKVLNKIANNLAVELQQEAVTLIDYMTKLLWGSKEVEARLSKNSQAYLEKLENSLSVLFLRFARPVAEALIRGPVNSDTRNEIVKSLGVDIEIVDNYYTGNEPAFEVLKRYVKYGVELLISSQLRKDILGVAEVAQQVAGIALEIQQDIAESQIPLPEKVILEVTTDLAAFQESLMFAIFDAANFESYCIQELRGLVDNFREKEGVWSGVAMNEWYRKNTALLSQLPESLQPQEFNVEVSHYLRQLGVALKRDRPFDD